MRRKNRFVRFVGPRQSDQFYVGQLPLVSGLVAHFLHLFGGEIKIYLGLAVNRRKMVICPAVSGRNINTDTVTPPPPPHLISLHLFFPKRQN